MADLVIVELNNMTLKECFNEQILSNPEISSEVLEKVEYKHVWSGALISEGDRVLYAFVLQEPDKLLLASFLERELDSLSSTFVYHDMHNETIPILKKIK